MLQLRIPKARMVLLLSVLAMLVVLTAILVLSHTTLHPSLLPDGAFGDH